jgi:hypothetical protein
MILSSLWLIFKLLGIPLVVFVVWATFYEDKEDGGPRGVIAIGVSRTLLALWCVVIFIRGLFW